MTTTIPNIFILFSLQFLIIFCLFFIQPIDAVISCMDITSFTTNFVGKCVISWNNLKPNLLPMQAEVGYAWIAYKIEKDFTNEKHAQETMNTSSIPVVFGPGNKWYLVDDHHTLCALDHANYPSTMLILDIICDYRHINDSSIFWKQMQAQNLVYFGAHINTDLNTLPRLISSIDLPNNFSFTNKHKSLTNDAFRALAGFSRKVTVGIDESIPTCNHAETALCERCMYRGCGDGYQVAGPGVAFFEFRWAYFMQDATYTNTTPYWESEDDWKLFKEMFGEIYKEDNLDKINTSKWMTTASSVVPLCRSLQNKLYSLPSDIFPLIGDNNDMSHNSLPGYYAGYEQLTEDPNCDSPSCVI